MEDSTPRLFGDDEAVRRIGTGLICCTLTKADWTHEAHIAACAYLLLERSDLVPEQALPFMIRRFNLSAGGINDDEQGYHETITQVFIRGARIGLEGSREEDSLSIRVNHLLLSAFGRRDWPLRFFSPERLFSREARRGWVEPDLHPLPVWPLSPGQAPSTR